jgi:tRNA threonylcarbamoyladenosine biosynthesis protein TsaE
VCRTRSARETEAAGAALGARLVAGDCVCLLGPLGAGKTTFVRGALRALGVRRRASSPTYVLAHEHRGRVPVAHLDFYRLTIPAADRGLLDYLDGRRVVFVEWADRDRSYWPRRVYRVRLARLGPALRRITIQAPGRRP